MGSRRRFLKQSGLVAGAGLAAVASADLWKANRPALRHAARWLHSQWSEHALVLGYHRIAADPVDPYSMSVTPEHFEQHLRVIREHGRPMTLQGLLDALANGDPLDRAVIVTFDDGYLDLLSVVEPLLERYQIPATAFLVSGFLGREFWWDTLARLVMTPTRLPRELRLAIDGDPFTWNAPANPAADTSRTLAQELSGHLGGLSADERQAALEKISIWSEVPLEVDASPRALTRGEIRALVDGGLFEIGSHSRTHARLPLLPPEDLRSEIAGSKTDLEEWLGRPVTHFAYPYGESSPDVVARVRDAGFTCGCNSWYNAVRRDTARFELPRFWVGDWDRDRFRDWFEKWNGRMVG